MNIPIIPCAYRLLRLGFLAVVCLLVLPGARAGVTLEMHIVRFDHGQAYKFFTPLYTNSTPPAAPLGTYFISSPFYSAQQPTNGSWREMQISTNGVVTLDGTENPYPDFNSVMRQITNGTWTMVFTNNTTTNTYTFKVSAPNMTSNMLPATVISYPTDGTLNVPNQPTFTWQGPTNWPVYTTNTFVLNYDSSFYFFANGLPATQENWTPPGTIPNGVNCTFYLDYQTNSTPVIFTASTPLDSHSQAFGGWVSTDVIETGDSVFFAITNPPVATPTLVAHYTFDNSGNPGQDSSGNGYDLDFNGGDGVISTNNAKAGSNAAYFDGNSFFSYSSTPTNVLNTLAGDFSLSFWIKTTQNDGNENGDAFAGDGIVAADVPGMAYDLVPAALDGGQIGFNTGGHSGDDTVNSTVDIIDGNYHHVVITRTESTGEKQIYIDGVLNNTDIATLNPLSDPRMVAIGCAIDASQSDPSSVYATPHQFLQGLLDDLQLYAGVLSSNQVAQIHANPGATAGQTFIAPLVARYNFEVTNSPGTDSSGNGNDANCGSGNGGTNLDTFSTDAAVGTYAREYFGDTSICFYPNGAACFNNLSNTLYGSFSWTAWVKTTNSVNTDYANAYFGAPIWFEYGDGTNQAVFSITGSKAAFAVGNPDGGSDTVLHSTTSVNDGNYHFLAATRNQASGLMSLYVDGNLEATGVSTNGPRIASAIMYLAGGYYANFAGLLDDVRVYGGELSSAAVAALSGHPLDDFNLALNTTGLPWTTSGGANWFVESTNTYNSSPAAAQSGSVINSQSSTLYVTVTGPGTLTFCWASQDDCNNFYYEFAIDGISRDSIQCSHAWSLEVDPQTGLPYKIPAGQHTLTWTTYANGDTDPTEAGFLDQVSYVPDTAPNITLNPFSQTNYPGYSVWLSANATSTPAATWQWYKVGVGAISGATSYYYIPTNSGTAGVAGSYYAIASDDVGSAITTTASVSFVSAPLPPDWSLALKSPFQSVDSGMFNKDYYYGCAVDPAGDIYVAAQYYGNMDVLTNGSVENVVTAVGTNGAAALVKHAANGKPIWGVGLTNSQPASYSYGVGVALAPGNGAYLESDLVGTNWLGTNSFANHGAGSILLSRFDANGSNIWSRLIGKTNGVFGLRNTVVSDATGNVTVAGVMTSGTIDVGGTNLTLPSGFAGFMVQYDGNGTVRWAQVFPDFPFNLACSSGKLYVSLQSGVSSGVTNVSIGALSNVTDRAWGVACLNATNGQALWLRGVGEQYGANDTGGSDNVPLISISGTNVFLIGTAYGASADFGGLSVSWPGARGQYFARFDINGSPQVATSFGSPTTATWASAASTSGVYVCGDFNGYSSFGTDLIAAPIYAQNDLGPNYFTQPFVAKFDRNGNPLWARNGVSSDLANFRGLATTADGVWASGFLRTSSLLTLAQFGTNYVYSDYYIVSVGIFGTIYPTQGGMLAKITDSSAIGLPVLILNPQDSGVNFQLSFQSQLGFMHPVQYRTDLMSGIWQTYSNVTGDGTLKTVPVPLSVFGSSPQGFIRVSTQ